jgi:hypothetical protein
MYGFCPQDYQATGMQPGTGTETTLEESLYA